MLRLASFLVPHHGRQEWLQEWQGELWHLPDANGIQVRFCLGAFKDAAWLRRNIPEPPCQRAQWFRSPGQCIAVLSALAAVSVALSFYLPGPHDALWRGPFRDEENQMLLSIPHGGSAFRHDPLAERRPISEQFFVMAVALLILPTFTRFALGEYPAKTCSRRWIFLALKATLILPLVFFGSIDLSPGTGSIQPLAALIGYTWGFRWILTDQRQRCPICLRLLSNPARIGRPSSTLLEWYGTELMCAKGHGLLHISEASTISFGTQRWTGLGQSWQHLF